MTRSKRWFYVTLGSALVALLLVSVMNVPQALAHGPGGGGNDYDPGYGMGMGEGMMNNGHGMGRGMTGRGYGMGWNGNFGPDNQEWGQMPGYGHDYGQMPGYGNGYQQMPGYGNGFQQMPHAGRGFWQMPGSGMLNGWWGSPMPNARQESDDSWWPW
jgi:hypothetical protein